jgi:rRNA maturation protein Nop10
MRTWSKAIDPECMECGELVDCEIEYDEFYGDEYPIIPDVCPHCGESESVIGSLEFEREDFYADL